MVGALTWVGIAAGGAVGALARYRVDGFVSRRIPTVFPIGTLVVNLSGSFPLGLLVGLSSPHGLLLIAGTGFLGGYTTFSTWMVETERLGENADLVRVIANLAISMLLGLAMAAAGWYLGDALR